MKEKPKVFQIVLIGVFIVMIIVGFLAFSNKLPLPKGNEQVNYGEVVLWGTLPQSITQSVISEKLAGNKSISIKYVQKKEVTFDQDFIEALASGTGPDLVLLQQDRIVKTLNKLSLIPYQVVTERDFKTNFIEGTELFLRPGGIIALPFTVDPLVMYWNRDIFTNASLVTPPTKWSQFYDLASKTTVRERSGSISQSFVAFGAYDNVTHAKDVLSMLLIQAGKPIVALQPTGVLKTDIAAGSNDQGPAALSINFFNEFSRSDKSSYTWNRALPASRDAFAAGDLALYFGYASEYADLKKKNPHLNFDVALVPQVAGDAKRSTYGTFTGIAITKASKNPQGALVATTLLSTREIAGGVAQKFGLPPVRRDLLSAKPTDAASSVFYDSAVIARSWPDPDPVATEKLFANLINDVISGRSKISQALFVFESSLARLIVQ